MSVYLYSQTNFSQGAQLVFWRSQPLDNDDDDEEEEVDDGGGCDPHHPRLIPASRFESL